MLRYLVILLFCNFMQADGHRARRRRRRKNKDDNTYPTEIPQDCLEYQNKCTRQKCLVEQIYESIIYPSSLDITLGITRAPTFADEVTGRVNPVGTFSDYESSLEYFYGLVNGQGVINRDQPGTVVTDINVIQSLCDDDIVSIRVDVFFSPLPPITDPDASECLLNGRNLTQTGFYKFNEEGTEVIKYDLALLNLDIYNKVATSPECTGLDTEIPESDVINGICIVEDSFCNDVDNQYDSFQECIDYLTQKEYGDWNRAALDNVVCRSLHSFLVPLRPDIHCNHIGPQSTKCVDTTYSEWYQFQL